MQHSVLSSILEYLHGDGLVILPEMELLLFALGILIFDFLLEKKEKHWNAILALFGVAASAFGLFLQSRRYNALRLDPAFSGDLVGFHNTVVVDGFFLTFAAIFLAATALVALLSIRYLDVEREQEGEYYALLLLACIGMMFMASGNDLIVLFLGLETMALSFYVMTGFLRANKRSNEAALKYLLLGAFSTGILAYGFSLLYGASASAVAFGGSPSTNLARIGQALEWRLRHSLAHSDVDGLVVLAFVTVAAGMFFKVAAVPFHQWAPDVYEGAPTPVTAYVSVGSKTASFAMFIRLVFTVFGDWQATWLYLVAGVAIASLTWGNLAALTQTNVKRLLAYSSIAHAGYILVGFAAVTGMVNSDSSGELGASPAYAAVLFYLLSYALVKVGAFTVVSQLGGKDEKYVTLEDYAGLSERHPVAAAALSLFLLSLLGLPVTAGFFGKFYIFKAAVNANLIWLAIFVAVNSIIGAYYYFRLIVAMYMREPADQGLFEEQA